MKKKILLAVVLVLLFAAAVTIVVIENRPETTVEETAADVSETTEESAGTEAEAAETASEETETATVETIDYDALYAAYAPETVIGTMDGRDITWEEYYGWLSYNISQMESTMDAYRTYYGMEYNWSDDSGAGDGTVLADLVTGYAESYLKGQYAIQIMLEEGGKELSEENKANIASARESDKEYCCGEGATDEEFLEYLKEIHMTEGIYNYVCAYAEYQKMMLEMLYGEDLKNLSEDKIQEYIDENGYLNVNHILLLTTDSESGEELDEEAKAERLAKAEEMLAELKKIKDNEKLVKRFRELKDEYCEDGGKVTNPDGYVFTEGTMVEEFEEAAKLLENYGLSDIVETTYGYHILLRLPITGDTVVEENDGEDPDTIKSLAAETECNEILSEKAEALEFVTEDSFKLNMADYIIETAA